MKKIYLSMMALAIATFTFTACEDVPEPYNNPYNQIKTDDGPTETIDPAGSGTADDPYNVAAAQQLIASLGADVNSEVIYVKGVINDLGAGVSDQYWNAQFYIADNMDGTNQLLVYRSNYLQNEKFTSTDQIKEGDEVVMCGMVVNYKGNTPEFTTGTYIYSLNGETGGGDKPDTPTEEVKAVSVKDFLAAAVSSDVWYELTGTVTHLQDGTYNNSTKYGNFDLVDETGSVYVYGVVSEKGASKGQFEALMNEKGIKDGSKITIIGNRAEYKEAAQVGNAYFVKVENGDDNQGSAGGSGTADDPYSVAKALQVCAEVGTAGTSDNVYAAGIITSIKEISTSYGNATFVISDDADGTNALTVYRAYSLGNAKFTSEDEIKVGDKVVICGKLVNYNNKTPEFTQGCYIYSKEGSGDETTSSTGTFDNPLTASQAYDAVAAMEKGVTSEADYYVKGKITSIKYEFSAQYGTATFNFSDDGNASDKEFIAYSTYYFGPEQKWVEGNTQVKVGDEVIVCGKVVNYNGNTPEFASKKNYVVKINSQTAASRQW